MRFGFVVECLYDLSKFWLCELLMQGQKHSGFIKNASNSVLKIMVLKGHEGE